MGVLTSPTTIRKLTSSKLTKSQIETLAWNNALLACESKTQTPRTFLNERHLDRTMRLGTGREDPEMMKVYIRSLELLPAAQEEVLLEKQEQLTRLKNVR
jgi:hypothetical protein